MIPGRKDSTFLITDWLTHTPKDVLAKNFGVNEQQLATLPKKELSHLDIDRSVLNGLSAEKRPILPNRTG